MPWQIRMVEPDKQPKEIGDAWYIPESQIKTTQNGRRFWYGHILSQDYENNRSAQRQPIAVTLPCCNGYAFCVDSDATSGAGGWRVSGDPPNVTVSPSINIVGLYHGWIQNGVISDDCEGRTFP